MGCDIHLFVEYKKKNSDYWYSFGKKINPGRIYGMFAKLADVRNSFSLEPIASPRGLPEDIGLSAFEAYTHYISDHITAGNVTKEKAAEWVEKGYSKYMRDEKFVSNPDWHSASWCTTDELESCIKDVWRDGYNGNEIEWVALIDLMRSFERQGRDVRAVFWFDS